MLASLLTLLAACSPVPAVRTETVTVNVPVYKALDPALTTPVPEVADPPWLCRDTSGAATVCDKDLAEWGDAWRSVARKANSQLRQILGLQPAK